MKLNPILKYVLNYLIILIGTLIFAPLISVIRTQIGLLQQTITWYKIGHAGGQAHYYSRTGTLKQRDLNQSSLTCLYLCPSAGIIMSLPSSMADFVPCDLLLQKAYSGSFPEKMRGQRGTLKALAGICYVHESYF